MTLLVLALLVATPAPPPGTVVEVRQNGTLKGSARVLNFTGGASVTVNTTTATATIAIDGGTSSTSGDGGSFAPAGATFITQTCNASLTAEQCLSANGTGIMISTTTTGVVSTYAGTSCANQFPRSLSATGVATCAKVALASDVSGVLDVPNGGTSSAPAADDQVLVSDSTAAATWRTVPNCTDTGGNHLNYTAATNGWSCGTSQLHDVGGSSPQVQYNNAGAFGGLANVEGDGTHLNLVGVTAPPAAPSLNRFTPFGFQFDAGMPPLPYTIDGYYGIPSPAGIASVFSYYSTVTKWSPGCYWPHGWGTTTVNLYNTIQQQNVGNAAGPSWASTSLLTRSKILRLSTSAAKDQNAGVKSPTSTQWVWRGNATGAGGWLFWTRWAVTVNANHIRQMVGLQNGITFPATTANPSVQTDAVYVGCDSLNTASATNLSICSNDNSGSATCNDLGSSFPCDATANIFYDVWLTAEPNASSIEWRVDRLDSAASAAGTITSDLPRNTVQMNPIAYANTADGGTAISFDFAGTCVLSNL